MEEKKFKIRLCYYDDNDKEHYIDELKDWKSFKLNCVGWSWIEIGSGYYKGSRDYINRENWYRMCHEFSDEDVIMETEFVDGMVNITLIASDLFDKKVTCLIDKKLVTRTLFDWTKIVINGQLSDGVGENPVGEYNDYEIWLGELITDEETDGRNYFKVGEAEISDDYESVLKPGYLDEHNYLVNEYNKCFDENKNIINREKCSEIYDLIEELNNDNTAWVVERLKEL